MKKAIKALDEIDDFINSFNFSVVSYVTKGAEEKNLYSKFQALLLCQFILDQKKVLKRLGFFDEFLSDASSAYLFLLTSAYKPSNSMLRSSVENVVRTVLTLEGLTVTEIDSVWKLFETAKRHFKEMRQIEARQRVSNLHGSYGELCKTVHSVSYEFMSLRVPFSRIYGYEQDPYLRGRAHLIKVFQDSLELIYIVAHKEIGRAHYKVSDAIRDALSPAFKAQVLAEPL